jgi:quinol monooxygenase YgiN
MEPFTGWSGASAPGAPRSLGAGDEKTYSGPVIFIAAKFRVRPEHADSWADISREFTDATRAEPGNLWFDWSRSLDDPAEYVLVEAFRDADAGGAHVQSAHFKQAIATLPAYLVETPRIMSQTVDQDDWSELAEMRVD